MYYAAFTSGHISPGNMYPGRATCFRIHTCRLIHVAGYKLLVRDTCTLYLGDIITIHYVTVDLYPFVSGNRRTTNWRQSPIQETCWRRQVDTSCIRQHVSWCKRGFRFSFCWCIRVGRGRFVVIQVHRHDIITQTTLSLVTKPLCKS